MYLSLNTLDFIFFLLPNVPAKEQYLNIPIMSLNLLKLNHFFPIISYVMETLTMEIQLGLLLVCNLSCSQCTLHKLKITFGAHGGDLGFPWESCHPSEMFLI